MAAAAQGMAGGASNFIGSLISLISKSDIRYQGFLAQIDAEEATIALEKVRSWGTEGRLVQQGRPSSEELPPNDNVYESIVFRAADVKDLKIDDPNPQRNVPAPPPQLPHDPAIMNSGSQAPYGAPYGRPPPPGQGYSGPQFGAAPPPLPPNVPYGAPGFPPYARPPPPQNLQPTPQAAPKSQKSPAPPAAAAKAAEKKDEKSTDAVAEHLSKLKVAGAANLPQNGTSGKGESAGPANKANANLPAVPRAAAAAAAAAAGQERHGSVGRSVPGSGGRQRGPQSSVFDNPVGRRGNAPVEVPDTDFDFDASNAKFAKQPKANGEEVDNEKEEEGEEQKDVLSSIPPPSEGKSFYDKSSFFDSISNEVTERQEGQQSRQTAGEDQGQFGGRGGGRGGRGGGRGRADRLAEERRNMDTFGEVGSFGGGPRGRGRGRGRGGRGRGGRGRGDGFRGGRGGQAATFS